MPSLAVGLAHPLFQSVTGPPPPPGVKLPDYVADQSCHPRCQR
jgi:hypothetical protein